MEQALGQAIPLRHTSTAEHDGLLHVESAQTQQVVLRKHWLQTTAEDHFLRPKTRKGQILCWSCWVLAVAAGCVLFWQVLPRFVDHGECCATAIEHFSSLPLTELTSDMSMCLLVAAVKPTIQYIEVWSCCHL